MPKKKKKTFPPPGHLLDSLQTIWKFEHILAALFYYKIQISTDM